jgi:hypothetical protein
MKIRELLKQLEGLDPELEIVGEGYNVPLEIEIFTKSKENFKLPKYCVFYRHAHPQNVPYAKITGRIDTSKMKARYNNIL